MVWTPQLSNYMMSVHKKAPSTKFLNFARAQVENPSLSHRVQENRRVKSGAILPLVGRSKSLILGGVYMDIR